MLEGLRQNRTALLVVYLPSLAFLMAVALQDLVPVSYLTRDPAEITGAKSYIGLVSNLGILMWSASSAIALFAATVFRLSGQVKGGASFFFTCGVLAAVLMLDDLLLIHERLAPNHLHIPQPAVVAFYALMFLVFLVFFRATILNTDFVFLVLFFIFLGISAGWDGVSDRVPQLKNHLIEDGSKFFGIVSWLAYIVLTALARIQQIPRRE